MKPVEIIETLNTWTARIAAVILAFMTLLILVEILLWNIFDKSTIIADEYSAYGLAAIVFLGAGYCLKQRGHIRIALLLNLLPKKAERTVTFVVTVICTLFMGYLLIKLYEMTVAAFRYGSTSGTLSNTRLWIPQSLMLFGGFVFFLQLIASSIETFLGIRQGEDIF